MIKIKRILKLLTVLLIGFIFLPSIHAKEAIDFACNYRIYWVNPELGDSTRVIQPGSYDPNANSNYSTDSGYFQIMVKNYKNNKPNITIYYYKNKSDLDSSSNYTTVNFGKSYKNGKNIHFFDSEGNKEFINNFSNKGSCPNIYAIFDVFNTNNLYISSNTDGFVSDKVVISTITPIITFLRSEDGGWKSYDSFYSSDNTQQEKIKQNLVCNYELEPKGEYYDTGINSKGTSNKINVTLTTNVNPSSGDILSYNINVNNAGKGSYDFTSLDEDQQVRFSISEGNPPQNKYYNLLVESDQLKKIFNGEKCLNNDELYVYLDQRVESSDASGYRLTTSKEEMDKYIEDVDENHDNSGIADSDGNGRRPSTPSMDLDASQKSCKDALGANLTAVVKASIKILQIAGAIITIVKGMMLLIPAVIAKDADGLKKASGTLVTMAIILVIIFLLPAFVKLIGHIFDFDLTCFFD